MHHPLNTLPSLPFYFEQKDTKFLCRRLEDKDVNDTMKLLCDSFNGSLFTEEEIKRFRTIKDVFERKSVILAAASKKNQWSNYYTRRNW